MPQSLSILSITAIVLGLSSCRQLPDKHWTTAIPQKTLAVIIPESNVSPIQVMEEEYIPFLDDITSSAIQLISQVDSYPTVNLELKALSLYPDVRNKLQPVWIVEAPGYFIENLQRAFYRDFTQNKYYFQGQTMHKLHIRDRILFAAQLHELLLLSESSLAIEDAIRSYLGISPVASIDSAQIKPPSLILNTRSMDRWVAQLAKVGHHPDISGSFKGLGPAVLNVSRGSEEKRNELEFTGNIPLTDEPTSELVAALSTVNSPLTLDRYISSNASSFAIFRLSPRLAPPSTIPDTTRLDSLLLKDIVHYAHIARALNPEFALVTYAESGFLSTGEHLYLRRLKDRNAFLELLNELAREGFLRRIGNTYFAQSQALAGLIGSELCNYTDFYLEVTGDIVVISKRQGLAEVVESDRSRRRVIYYDPDYMNIRRNLPSQVSGFVFANTDFYDFIEPYLAPNNYVNAITSKFSQLTISLQLDQDLQNLAFHLRTYTKEESDIPYEEQWFFPTGGADLSGEPVLADLRGSRRDEIVFATNSGSVYMLATDGTIVMQANTDSDRPVGSPVVYDWYATNQNVILLAAGNKIYGWDDTGTALPKFPFELDEPITTPLTVSDLNKNGLPEAIVATADRKLHVLDGRGNNISGWPLTTNAVIRHKPVVDFFQGDLTLIAFSENAVHAWNPDGSSKNTYPRFINASLTGSPVLHKGQVLGGAADGYLYAIGENRLFSDSLNVYSNLSGSSDLEAVYISNSPLTGSPSIHSLTVQSEEGTFQETMILTMSNNGSMFLVNEQGQLRFTQSMGQPAARDFSPFIVDLHNDGVQEIIALAGFGRLYAWQVTDGERIYALPTSGMKYPIVTDLDGNGNKELIAQTREGVRCWTMYGRVAIGSGSGQ